MSAAPFPTRSAIEHQQLGQLRQLLCAILPGNCFYAEKFAASGVPSELSTLGDLTRFPFTTKRELVDDQLAFPPFGSNLSFPINRYTRYHQTSGTSGVPLRWLDTPEAWNWMLDRWIEIFSAAAVGKGDRIVFAFSFGPFIGFWLAFEAAASLGALCLPAGGLSSIARLAMILDNRATVLCCTPTYALHLGQTAREERIDLNQ